MIKKGDKLVCVTDGVVEIAVHAPLLNGEKFFLKKGDVIEISSFYADYVKFEFNGQEKLYLLHSIIAENFINLAEWRNKQIDSILEDD